MPQRDEVEIKTSESLDELADVLENKRRLRKMFDELDGQAVLSGRGYAVVARWRKRQASDNLRACPVFNRKALKYVLAGYLEGDNHDLQFVAMHWRIASQDWKRGNQSHEYLFM